MTMDQKLFDMPKETDIAWCPGCGNFPLLTIVKMALAELEIAPETLVSVSGIGQAGKAPHYYRTHVFNGLHGRALSAATGIKMANPELTVIVESGDGDIYGEGGNHLRIRYGGLPLSPRLSTTIWCMDLRRGRRRPPRKLE